MIDELDFAFEEYPDRGRHRHRHVTQQKARKKKRKKKRRRGRTALALLLVFLLLGGLGGVAWYGLDRIQGYFTTTPDYKTAGVGEVSVEVKENETLTDVANTLYRNGVVKSAQAFIEACDAEPRSANIQPGTYKLRQQMRAADALTMLLDLKNRIVNGVTIKEGAMTVDIYKHLSEKTGVKVEDFVAAAKDPIKLGVPDFWFKRSDGKQVPPSIEGFLFPATYEFGPGMTAEQMLKQMVAKFLAVATEVNFVERVEKERGGITPYDALIVASLAQAEAGVPEDIGKVARVAYNRLYQAKMPLQFDVTVNYHWKITGGDGKASRDMTTADLNDPRNPYSTHAHAGLPPTPIGSPGKLALEGAMAPPDGGWLYFVAIDQNGTTKFAETYQEHQANEAIARRNGVLR